MFYELLILEIGVILLIKNYFYKKQSVPSSSKCDQNQIRIVFEPLFKSQSI